MAKAFNLQETLLGSTLFFVEEGVAIEGGETLVSKSALPDDTPGTDWQTFGCANNLTPFRTTETDTPRICFDGNRYRTTVREIVTADGWEFEITDHVEPVWRLMLGLSAPIANDTPVEVFANNVREINGYLKFQARNVHSQGDVFVMDVWGKLTLAELPTYADKTVHPKLRFESMDSVNNIVELYNVADLTV